MTTSKTKPGFLFGLLSKFMRFFLINALRATLLLIAYLLRWSVILFETALLGVDRVANLVDVRVLHDRVPSEDVSQPAFSPGEIEVMAMRLPENVRTIEGIADHYSVSTRQARKVKGVFENKINVNSYSKVDNRVAV